MVAVMALVGHSDYGGAVGAAIGAATALAPGVRRQRQRNYCDGGGGAVIALARRLQWQRQHSDCGCGIGTMIAAMLLVGAVIAVTGAFVQRLW